MQLETETRADALIVRVDAARIDAAVALRFKDLMRETTAGEAERILLDLGAVDFIDSSGLGAIVAAMKQLGPGQRIDLVALRPNVDKVFRLTRMDTIFAIHADIDGACRLDAG